MKLNDESGRTGRVIVKAREKGQYDSTAIHAENYGFFSSRIEFGSICRVIVFVARSDWEFGSYGRARDRAPPTNRQNLT